MGNWNLVIGEGLYFKKCFLFSPEKQKQIKLIQTSPIFQNKNGILFVVKLELEIENENGFF